MTFDLDIRADAHGRSRLHFEHLFISDIHFLTKQCKAKGLSRMLSHISFDHLTLVGDIFDFWYAADKNNWDLPLWQQQAVGHLLRADGQKTYLPGNHDEILRGHYIYDADSLGQPAMREYRNMIGKSLYGVRIAHDSVYTDRRGRRFFVCHGDVFDNKLRQAQGQGLYKVGDTLIEASYHTEAFLRRALGHEEFSLVSLFAKSFAHIAERESNLKANAAAYAQAYGYDGVICGHSHIAGIEPMGNGALFINDGSSTGHAPQFFAEDAQGRMAILTWRKKGLALKGPDGGQTFHRWSDLGLPHFSADPEIVTDGYTDKAARLVSMARQMHSRIEGHNKVPAHTRPPLTSIPPDTYAPPKRRHQIPTMSATLEYQ